MFGSKARRGPSSLLPEEKPYVARACKKRVDDFATGRYCARQALAGLGVEPVPIGMAASRAPMWPAGVVGSITHTDGYAAAVVARSTDAVGVGLDSQRIRPGRITPGMARLILRPEEYPLVESGQRDFRLHLAFSAKEALYKCLNPLVNTYFGFEKAVVTTVDEAEQSFAIRLADDLSQTFCRGYTVQGRFTYEGEVLSALVYVPTSVVQGHGANDGDGSPEGPVSWYPRRDSNA